jgi:hypothetical protein
MKQIRSVIKLVSKWAIILGAIYIGMTLLSGLDFEARMGWFLAALAMAIAYVDGTQKERIATLEYRVDELSRRINGY